VSRCKPCEAARAKKGFKYYSTEQQRAIAEARENGEEVNVTVARTIRPAHNHRGTKKSTGS
jgi:hypothetical protein